MLVCLCDLKVSGVFDLSLKSVLNIRHSSQISSDLVYSINAHFLGHRLIHLVNRKAKHSVNMMANTTGISDLFSLFFCSISNLLPFPENEQ